MRKILLDKVREDFSHTHPEFNTLQSKSNTSPNTNTTTTNNNSSCINTIVNPFTLPSQLITERSTTTQPSNHVIPYNNISTSSVPLITNQSIVFPPPLLQGNSTSSSTPQSTAVVVNHFTHHDANNRLQSLSPKQLTEDEDEEMAEQQLNIAEPLSTNSGSTSSSHSSPESKKRKSTRRTSNTRRRSNSNLSNENVASSSTSNQDSTASPHQTMCCIQNCTKDVSNRLRFSLRCETEFKPDYVAKFWNNICNYCYFHDLYQWKKLNQQSDSNSSATTSSTTKRKNSSSGRKRANSSLSTNSTTSTRSSKSVKSDHQDQISNHHQDHNYHNQQEEYLSPPPPQTTTHSISQHSLPSINILVPPPQQTITTITPPPPSTPLSNGHSHANNLKKVNEVKKPLKIDTSFTLSTSLHKSNTPPNVVVNSYVDPSPVHKEDVNALLDFLSAASQNN